MKMSVTTEFYVPNDHVHVHVHVHVFIQDMSTVQWLLYAFVTDKPEVLKSTLTSKHVNTHSLAKKKLRR